MLSENQDTRILEARADLAEERLDIALPAEVMRRLDEAVELLDFSDRQEFIVSVLRRFLDRMGVGPR
ncbi:unnamed protein product [marine sediment metagenome]|uniref:Ribbon-helix-helix protein CopG domain-containing protein n=1 Tax=marine sediment metagenome TaxID=412755 RepID=X1NLK9_9ZZZZ